MNKVLEHVIVIGVASSALFAGHALAMVTIDQDGAVIDGQTIDGTKAPYAGGYACIYVTANNVTIKNSTFKNCLGSAGAISAEGVSGLLVDKNSMENSSMLLELVASYNDNGITHNTCHNINGPGDAAGCVKFNGVSGSGNLVSGNVSYNDPGYGNTEDIFSAFNTKGTPSSPVIFENNCVHGGNNTQGSGTAIHMGDIGGEYLSARNNIVIANGRNTGSSGSIAISGKNVSATGNRIMYRGTGVADSGKMSIGYYSGSQNCSMSNNQVDLRDAAGNQYDGYLDFGNCSGVALSGNQWKANLAGMTCGAVQSTATASPPATTDPAPTTSTSAPATTTSAPATTDPAPMAPVTTTSEPTTSTATPATTDPAPTTTTSAPATITSAPATTTSASATTTPTTASSSRTSWWRRFTRWNSR